MVTSVILLTSCLCQIKIVVLGKCCRCSLLTSPNITGGASVSEQKAS